MMLTTLQIRTIHVAYRQAGLNEAQYRTVLRNVADVASCKQLDNVSFEDVMAVFEDMGFRDPRQAGDYWRAKVAIRGTFCGARMVHKIHALSADCPRYPLPAMCKRMSGGLTDRPEMLSPKQAYDLVEAYKAIVDRQDALLTPLKILK